MKRPLGLAFGLSIPFLLAVRAHAQDSVSKLNGLPGDAVGAYAPGEQRNDYVVELTSFATSWGTTFGVAPLVKTSQDSALPAAFFNHLFGAQGISPDRRSNMPFPAPAYSSWFGPGFGINDDPSLNDPGVSIATGAFTGHQFGVAFAERGGTNFNSNNVVAGVVSLRAHEPGRLYVSRIAAAQNADSGFCKNAAVGIGGVDADGDVFFRADGFAAISCGTTSILAGNNYFGVDALARTPGTLNVLDNQYPAGLFDAPATSWIVRNSSATHNTPTLVPRSVTGVPFVIGTNFNKEFVRGSAFPATADLTHLNPASTDHRGNLGYTTATFPRLLGASNTMGTAAILGKSAGGQSNLMNVFGIGAGGAVTGTLALALPPVVTDNATGFVNTSAGIGANEFDHYHGQVAFQGGNGQIAVRKDLKGNLLAAAAVNYPTIGLPAEPKQYIAVARVAPDGTTAWTMAGYNDGSFDGTGVGGGNGKPILDGAGGSVVGRMVPLTVITGGNPVGPSVSAPMIDAVGNVWFLSAVELFEAGPTGPVSTFTRGLLRAVYEPLSFSYQLELVFKEGDVFMGSNSGLPYRIQFLSIANLSNVASETAWSGNVMEVPHVTVRPPCLSSLDPKRAESLGGLVLSAQIVYDVNLDGAFTKLTGAGGDPASLDQEYNVLLYLGALAAEAPAPSPIGGPIGGLLLGAGFAITGGVSAAPASQSHCP